LGWEAVKNAFWDWLFSIPLWGRAVALFGAAALGAGAKLTGAPWPIQLLVVFAMVLIVLHAVYLATAWRSRREQPRPETEVTVTSIVREHVDRIAVPRLRSLLTRLEDIRRVVGAQREVGVFALWKAYKRRRPEIAALNADLVRTLPVDVQSSWVSELPPESALQTDEYLAERIGLLRALLPELDKDAPRFGAPHQAQPSTDHWYKWWAIPVAAGEADIPDCTVSIIAGAIELPALWDAFLAGHEQSTTLRRSKPPRLVPIVIRSEILTSVPKELPEGVARITDKQFFIGDSRGYLDVPAGTHKIRVCIRSGRSEWLSPVYRLTVPQEQGNTRFDLEAT